MAIHVTIIGGGITGFCLAHALLEHPHMTFDIYEKSNTIRAIGQGVLLHNTARQSLRLIGAEIGSYPEQIGGFEHSTWTVAMGEGPYRGQISYQLQYKDEERPIGLDRTKFMEALMKEIPKERLHTGKRVSSVDDTPGSSKRYTVHFSDGTSIQTDAIIGADGLRSFMRHIVVRDLTGDQLVPRPLRLWDGRVFVPAARAQALVQEHITRPWGEGAIMLVGTTGNIFFSLGEGMQHAGCIVAGRKEQTASSSWRFPLSRGFLNETYGDDWIDLGKNVKEMILDIPDAEGFFEWDINPLPTFHRDRMCLLGDAAHAAAPWLAAGATVGIEGTAILGHLLQRVHSVSDFDAAFAAYTDAQLDRAHTLQRNSLQTAQYMVEGAATAPAELARLDRPLKDFLFNVDMRGRIDAAVRVFEKERTKL